MLKVKTYLDKSTIHGIGLFAAEDIKEGERIWEYNPHVDIILTKEQAELYKNLPSPIYIYKQDGKYYLSLDNDRYINHSEDANVANGEYMFMEDDYTYATRDIKAGEELTCDYREFMDDEMLEEYSFIASSRSNNENVLRAFSV